MKYCRVGVFIRGRDVASGLPGRGADAAREPQVRPARGARGGRRPRALLLHGDVVSSQPDRRPFLIWSRPCILNFRLVFYGNQLRQVIQTSRDGLETNLMTSSRRYPGRMAAAVV